MAWTYYCSDDDSTLSAGSKEELADKLVQHLRDAHQTPMTREQAMESVNKNAQQKAA